MSADHAGDSGKRPEHCAGMNNRGQVVGRCWSTDTPSEGRVFLWGKSRRREDSWAERIVAPMAVNDAGQVIGYRGSKQPRSQSSGSPATTAP